MKTRYQAAPSVAADIGTNSCTFLTIHETANRSIGANAKAHANLQTNGYKLASWHWTVDDKEAIQSHPHSKICWHAGSALGNRNSIGIEVCVNADGSEELTRENAAELAARILKEENIPLTNMVQHHHWTGKNCPTRMRADGWKDFVSMVAANLSDTPVGELDVAALQEQLGGLVVDGVAGPKTVRRFRERLNAKRGKGGFRLIGGPLKGGDTLTARDIKAAKKLINVWNKRKSGKGASFRLVKGPLKVTGKPDSRFVTAFNRSLKQGLWK